MKSAVRLHGMRGPDEEEKASDRRLLICLFLLALPPRKSCPPTPAAATRPPEEAGGKAPDRQDLRPRAGAGGAGLGVGAGLSAPSGHPSWEISSPPFPPRFSCKEKEKKVSWGGLHPDAVFFMETQLKEAGRQKAGAKCWTDGRQMFSFLLFWELLSPLGRVTYA